MTGNIYDAGTPGFNNGLPNSGGPLACKGLLNAAYVVQDPRVTRLRSNSSVGEPHGYANRCISQ